MISFIFIKNKKYYVKNIKYVIKNINTKTNGRK